MIHHRRFSPAVTRVPLRRMVFAVCIATWVLRAAYLSVPEPLSFDELAALTASDYGTASKFMAASNWAKRWAMVENISSGGRILWIFGHLIWGYLFPSAGRTAYLFTYVSALIATLALAGAARHLYGKRGFLLALLIVSVSPLFLNYTVRALGTMPSVMWICLALFFLSSSRSTLKSWIGGGFCLGLAFGTHYGTGVAILAITCGMGFSAMLTLLDRDVPRRGKVWKSAIAPVMGAIAAVAPLAALELWARYAGSSYALRLFLHENLRFEEAGPYGLWLREVFELDPLLQVILFVATAYTFRSASLSHLQKALLGIGYAGVFALLVASMDQATPRVFISLGLFALVGLAVYFTRLLERDFPTAHSGGDEIPLAPDVKAPFDCRSLASSILLSGVIFTVWPAVSSMPRLVFPAWPLFVLGLLGLMIRLLPGSYHAIVRGAALLGSLLFLIGAAATYHAKSAHPRADAYWLQHPHLKRFAYEDFWDTTRAGARLSTRSRYDVLVIGPADRLYPASAYEEEPYKILLFRQMLRDFNLEGVLVAEEIPWAYVFFEEARIP